MAAKIKPITICVPVYNGEKKIANTLDALKSLDPGLCDIHILDNASQDKTLALARTYAQGSGNLFIHHYQKNIGQPGNFNRCLQFATTPYFAWLGAGDVPLAGYYQQSMAYLENNPDCALCYSDDVANNSLQNYENHNWQGRITNYLSKTGLGNINFGLMRSSMLKKLLPWLYLLGNDHIVHLNILLHGAIHKIPAPLFKRDWPHNRSFPDYLRTCTWGRQNAITYQTTTFRSLDMLWGFFYLADFHFHDHKSKNEFIGIIRDCFYWPLKNIIDERITIVRNRLSREDHDARQLLESELKRISSLIR